jgi:hypothetical protein
MPVNRRTAIATMGVLPFAAPAPDPPSNRAAQFAIASAMSFFHGVMADEHVPLEQRLDAARGLISGALHLDAAPDAKTGTTY